MKVADVNQLQINSALPSPKGVALALLECCRREDVTINEIAKLIQTDPVLAGRLIQKANAANTSARPISSVIDAVSRIGLLAVKQLAMGFSLIDQYQEGPCKAFNYQQFWSHSLLMAIAAQELSKIVRVSVPEELFACGLMARIGSLALATTYPEKYAELHQMQAKDLPMICLEQQYLQTDHNQLTAAMLINFGIPTILVESVYFHEKPGESDFSEGSRPYHVVHLLHLAKLIADFGLTEETTRGQLTAELLLLGAKFGLNSESFGTFIDQILQEWQSWGKLLKISVSESGLPFDQLINAVSPQQENKNEAALLRILVVEDDPSNAFIMESLLSDQLGHTVYTATNGRQALSLAMEFSPHILVTDWIMPEMNGLELTQSLRATDWGQNLYVIMLTGMDDEEYVIKAFDAGINDYVTKPINIRTFQARLRAAWHYRRLLDSWERDRKRLKNFAAELALSNRKLEHHASTDVLTGLINRRAGMEILTKIWNLANRTEQFLVIMLIDIDHFKNINDTYGHAVGDKVLKEIGGAIRKTARKGDTYCRYGGEEFLVICENGKIDPKRAILFAERLRLYISQLMISFEHINIQVSVSIGVALKEVNMENEEQLLHAADKALYSAKNAGRNRTCLAMASQLINCSPVC